jgi:hypothetical protein
MIVYPTHKCFDDALEFIEGIIKDGEGRWAEEHLRLVHAICLLPGTDRRYAHAWVELDRTYCIQAGVIEGVKEYYSVLRRDLYRRLRVEVATYYDLAAIWRANRLTEHYGPWEPAYLALVRSDDDWEQTVEEISFGGRVDVQSA